MKTQADLYEAAAKVMRMCEGTEVNWWQCIKYYKNQMKGENIGFTGECEGYEFAIAIVEGRPVFVGDELYDEVGDKHTVPIIKQPFVADKVMTFPIGHKWSWNPPKPATVMVELTREDAETIADALAASPKSELAVKTVAALRKALES